MTWTYTLARDDGERTPCSKNGDQKQPCNEQGGTYLATARGTVMGQPRTTTARLCANHAAQLAAEHGLPWPTVRA